MPGQLFCRQCKAKFLLERKRETRWTDGKDRVQSVTDTDIEFTECQTQRKKLLSIGSLFVSLHTVPQDKWTNVKIKLNNVMNTIKIDISEVYKDSESDSNDKNQIKRKLMNWLDCTRQCKEN